MKHMRVVLIFLMLIPGMARATTYSFTTIDMPGFYKLATNVSNQITIASSNVTLDMNGSTVSGGTNGIVINSGLSNITIKNGGINSVSSDGIQVNAGCNDITLKDITVSNALRGISFSQVINGFMRNCDMQQSTTGLQLDTCHNITLQDCVARANTHAGYDILSSTTCSFVGCQAISTGDGNTDISSEVFGFVSAYGNGNIFERCIANATQALSVTGCDSIVAGFALRGDESCTKIINSESSNSETNVNGFTVPFGILLEGSLDAIYTVTGLYYSSNFPFLEYSEWSPDGQYVTISGDGLGSNKMEVASFDSIAETISIVNGLYFDTSDIPVATWSPNGQYIALSLYSPSDSATNVLQIAIFDRTDNSLKILGSALPYNFSEFIRAIDWSPDQRYFAIGGLSSINILQVFSFDASTGRMASVAGALGTTGAVNNIDWAPDGKYLAMVGEVLTGGTGDHFQVLSFDSATDTLTPLTGSCGTASFITGVAWSPDGQYIAVGGNNISTPSDNQLQIFSFDRTTDMLISITGFYNDTSYEVDSVAWSPDGKYVVVGGSISNLPGGAIRIFEFDRGAQSLESIAALFTDSGEGISVKGISWSPDGRFISGIADTTPNTFNIFSAIQFPQNNVIKGNTVYCNSGAQFPSGVGISAPSITNMVIGNSAFNNPIPRAANAPIVDSNYQFVTNVFDQLFGEGPSLTQNISTSALNPQPLVPDIPSRIKRTELLLESLIDNLL